MAGEGQPVNQASLFYPLTKMNFLVTVDSVSGVAAFNEVTGLDASVDIIEFRQGNASSLAPVKIQGLVKHGNLTLKMGYTRSQSFKEWVISCVSERRGNGTPRHSVTIELIDITAGAPGNIVTTPVGTVLWILQDAWVAKYTGPDLNASVSEVAIESVEIAYEELTIPN
jgi:phage tail-like protein